MSEQVKQVIVMRNDLNMRKGKMIAQGAHASIAFLTDKLRNQITDFHNGNPGETGRINIAPIIFSDTERQWIEGRFTKICVYVNSEEELLDIHAKAQEAGLVSYLITDAGATEFGGVETNTCCAIGPDQSGAIDPITAQLSLL